MLGGMHVLGVITAADMTAGHAQAQVNPGISHRQAFFTAIRTRHDFGVQAEVAAFLFLPALAPKLFTENIPGGHYASKFIVHNISTNILVGGIGCPQPVCDFYSNFLSFNSS
jgi:hypothetical protein